MFKIASGIYFLIKELFAARKQAVLSLSEVGQSAQAIFISPIQIDIGRSGELCFITDSVEDRVNDQGKRQVGVGGRIRRTKLYALIFAQRRGNTDELGTVLF